MIGFVWLRVGSVDRILCSGNEPSVYIGVFDQLSYC